MTTPNPFKSASLEDWTKAAIKSAPNGDLEALNWKTADGIVVNPLYTAEDIKDLPYTNTLPGHEPFISVAPEEEKKIRTNPAARVNDILKKVFGS